MRSASTLARTVTLLLLLALLALATYWAVRLLAPRPAIAPSVLGSDSNTPSLDPASRLFGSNSPQAATPQAPSSIQVSGVVSAGGRSVAVLSVSGKPSFVAVGDRIDGQTVLKSVSVDKVVIEQNGQDIELPTPARGDTSVLTGQRRTAASTTEPSTAVPVGLQRATPPPAGSASPQTGNAPLPIAPPNARPIQPPGGASPPAPTAAPIPRPAPAPAQSAGGEAGSAGATGSTMQQPATQPSNMPPNAVYDPNTGAFTTPPDGGPPPGSMPPAPNAVSPGMMQQMQQFQQFQQTQGHMHEDSDGSPQPINQ